MEKFERYMQELKELHLTLNEYKNLGEAASFKELEFSKQRRKYEEISEMIINCDLKPFNQENSNIDEHTTKKVLKDILSDLFPEFDIDSFIKKINVDKTIPSSKYDCVTEVLNDSELVAIHIYDYNYLALISGLGHEFIHSTFELMPIEELVKTISNIHYKELSSILMEMIVASKAEEKLNLPFMEAMTSTRLNHLKQIHEMLSVFLANEHTVKNDILMKSIIEKQKHETFTYTISDIYATHLFKYYMEDKKGFLKTFKGMLNKESTILELLNYYQISLKNLETINQYKKKIESASK